MNKTCARCEKTVYPTEELKCLDKVWHKGCFKCQECGMTLNMRTYKGYGKLPYCEAHVPKAKPTTMAETPELKRIAENTKLQSNVKYHADFEKSKGKFTQVADDPETLRIKANTKIISNVAYHGELEKKAQMEKQRLINEDGELVDVPSDNYHQQIDSYATEMLPAAPAPSLPPKNHYQTPTTQYQAPTTQYQAPTTQYQTPTTQYQAPTTQYQPPYQQAPKAIQKQTQYQPAGGMPPPHQVPQHQHQVLPHQHQIPPHQHQVPPHQHQVPPHQHQVPPHQHQVPQHLHQVPSHQQQMPQQKQQPYKNEEYSYQYQDYQQNYMQPKIGRIQDYDPLSDGPRAVPNTQRASSTLVYTSNNDDKKRGAHQSHQQQQTRQIGRVTDMDPMANEVPRPPTNHQSGANKMYIAMYDYQANDSDEVSFREGDIIMNVTSIDEGWMTGQVLGTGHTGMLPANYVAECRPDTDHYLTMHDANR